MAVQITDKFQYFKDLDGDALNSGYVYIGTSGFNAQETAITVYSDAAMTIPISQPIRTSGGYLVNNGSPINVYTSADYSILVKDSSETLVYSSLSGNIEATQTAAEAAQTAAETAQTNAETAEANAEQAVIDAAAAAQAVIDAAGISTGTSVSAISFCDNGTATQIGTEKYVRVGDIVTVSGAFTNTATGGGIVGVYLTLPVAKTITANSEVHGLLTPFTSAGNSGHVEGYITDDEAKVEFSAPDISAHSYAYTYTYEV